MELSLLYSSPLGFCRAVRQEESRLCMHIPFRLLQGCETGGEHALHAYSGGPPFFCRVVDGVCT